MIGVAYALVTGVTVPYEPQGAPPAPGHGPSVQIGGGPLVEAREGLLSHTGSTAFWFLLALGLILLALGCCLVAFARPRHRTFT